MDKHELVGLTLERLLDHMRSSPESFEYYDTERTPSRATNPTIVWQPRIQDRAGNVTNDPNNAHAVVITFNPMMYELTCLIFLKAPTDILSNYSGAKADSVTSSRRWFEKWRGNYRKFIKLRDLIIARDIYRENMAYLKKLSSVFPDTMDKHLL